MDNGSRCHAAGQNRDMLRLASSTPPLWRTDSTVQLGADSPVRLPELTPWQERLLDELTVGIPDAMLDPLARSLGADPGEAQDFVDRIGGALQHPAGDLPSVRLELPADTGHDDERSLVAALTAAGLRPRQTTRWSEARPDPSETVIAVSNRLTSPHRAGRLMAGDVTHLPIELAGDRVSIGPLVVPGVTACLACRNAHRRDRDPSWPQLAAQLLGRAAVPTDPALLVEAAAVAVRLLRAGACDPAPSVTLSAGDGRRLWRAHRPHPACLCRSPGGTSTVAASPPPTTATACAQPA